ncbi:hypothetical protein B0H63DRAFT_304002 [Podospora didyma]|uniref:Vacuolar protein sorting-associated protein n=1 Tax=Podospora didyma TaxID=330526 RepID=A0AAE0K4G1_9PEZI|nr:hypothetical protein B0H63DRAFT_304002 [Podospora didyma]
MIIRYLRRATIAFALLATLVLLLWLLPRLLNPTPPDAEERERDQEWVNSSPYWIDRQACRWLSLCGVQHLKWDAPALSDNGDSAKELALELIKLLPLGWMAERNMVAKAGASDWETATMQKDLKGLKTASGAKILEEIPDYVLAHAPLVHLYSGENFWPSDIVEHVKHMSPFENQSLLNISNPSNLDNLGALNAANGTVFLTSQDDVESRPEWLHSHSGIPVPFEDNGDSDEGDSREDWGWRDQPNRPSDSTRWWDADKEHPPNRVVEPKVFPEKQRRPRRRRGVQKPIVANFPKEDNKPDPSGYSNGPAVLVLVDKGSGILDAFWFYFYSYNLGQTVLNIRFGNHIGDWEHCMVRFEHGIPRAMFLSEHAGGKTYAWAALEKRAQKGGKPPRPVIYSAVGSHAMYASSGMHPYVLPFNMLKDVTDKGPLWDPALNNYAYWYDYEVDRDESESAPDKEPSSLVPAASNPKAPTSWFHFDGYWGDDTYPLKDKRQWRLFGEYHYTTGPLGPKFKNLDRRKVCPGERCTILESIEAGKKSTWYS